MGILALILIIPVVMFVVGIIGFGWMVWDDYKSGHTRHSENFLVMIRRKMRNGDDGTRARNLPRFVIIV